MFASPLRLHAPARAALLPCLLAAACATQLASPEVTDEAVRLEQQKQREVLVATGWRRQVRLFDVAARVRIDGAELCGDDVAPLAGMVIGRLADYPSELFLAAVSVFGEETRPVVRHVVPGLPADRAGLQAGDVLLEVGGRAASSTRDALALMEAADGPLSLAVERDGTRHAFELSLVPACAYPAGIVQGDAVNAFADGNRVMITQGMMRFTERDDELALVVGHEIAHNALGHRGRKTTNQVIGMILGGLLDVAAAAGGVNTGGAGMELGSRLGATAFSKGFESEADYMGCYLAARAGFDVSDAAMFWRRMAVEHPGNIEKNYLATHPSSPERSVGLDQAVREIDAKRGEGLPLVPERKE